MKKNTNIYRKCAYCPHHREKQMHCCCKTKQISRNRFQNTSRGRKVQSSIFIDKNDHNYKLKQNLSTIPNIAMSLVPNNISYSNNHNTSSNTIQNKNLVPSIMMQNSVLKNENNNLKKQLMNVSIQLKDDYTIYTTIPTLQTNENISLHDKLYTSNKTLQQSIIKIDQLSKKNKEIFDININLESKIEQYKLKNESLQQDISNLYKKIKKYKKKIEEIPNKFEINKIIKNNMNLLEENKYLQDQIRNIKQEYSNKNNNYQNNENHHLSPQWIAHTSNKITSLENNISKIQEQSNIKIMHQNQYGQTNINTLKNTLAKVINATLNQSRKYQTTFDDIGSLQQRSILELIEKLLQSVMQFICGSLYTIQNDINRKLLIYDKNINNMFYKLQNMTLMIKNEQLLKDSSNNSCQVMKITKKKKKIHQQNRWCYSTDLHEINAKIKY